MLNRSGLLPVATALLVAGCGVGSVSAPAGGGGSGNTPPREAWDQPVPKAACQPGDNPEVALQGQVPQAERLATFAGYNCNLALVGQFPGDGASWQMAWLDDCAYYGTATGRTPDGSPKAGQTNPGAVVIDSSNSAAPTATAYLASISMLDPWESLKINDQRRLLAGVNAHQGAVDQVSGGPEIDIYDVSGDCRAPTLLASQAINTEKGHAGHFAEDGLTYYTGTAIRAVDVADPSDPKFIPATFAASTHDISTNAAGTRAYQTILGAAAGTNNGLTILDVSEIQYRQPDPQVNVVSELFWPDGAGAQMTQPITIAGKPYLVFVDEGISGANKSPFCQQGLPPFGMARLIDISDEQNPFVTAKLKLETHDPANCADTINDDQGVFLYDSHYCTASDGIHNTGTYTVQNVKIIACSYFESGLRVFDVRDPYRPKEIAYYNPPARPGYQAGSNFNSNGTCQTADWATAHPRIRVDRNEIWFTSQCNGFQVVRFEKPLAELLGPAP
jgi:hypothetical protein